MSSQVSAAIAVVLYLLATGLIAKVLVANPPDAADAPSYRGPCLALAGLAVIFHVFALVPGFISQDGINFSFFNTAALVTCIVVVLLIFSALTKPVDKLGIVIFPLAAISVLLEVRSDERAHVLEAIPLGMEIHILASILSYSLLTIAAVQALMLALQDWQLRARRANRLIRSLPPLQTMESLLFQMIGIGFVLLSISLVSGLLFVYDIFAQHLAHKTVLSLLAWALFGILLWGRVRHGWRGPTAIRWTLGGFFALLLAYFGSKMVLEIILERT